MSDINTVNVNLDINPALWAADRRVQQHLPPEYTLAFINLMLHAMRLSATSESGYTDGEFSLSGAILRVEHLTDDAVEAIASAGLAWQVENDTWAVDFVTPQTPHEALQSSADARERAGKTKHDRAIVAKTAQNEVAAKVQHRREMDKERQRRHRDLLAEAPETDTYTKPLVEDADALRDHTGTDTPPAIDVAEPRAELDTAKMKCSKCDNWHYTTVDGIPLCWKCYDAIERGQRPKCNRTGCESYATPGDDICYTHYREELETWPRPLSA
ncbi:hypothetical protein HGA11_22035 [Mycolicibacterium septicum DSM 44393]|uniref:Uncharacterized protein n=1 Tax=Mycolicibacterium septicum DSM 44393 TaxID=1341646 RepID=A0A7X6MSG2_9MYCO|nr:hypothetical protein [Mycolicibacterium septicum]NKZ13661.1 hypothetical protein [Mycolicibacterium septicum DSM 44393]